MKPILGRFEPQIYAILRIVAGLLFAGHGSMKLLGWPGDGGGGGGDALITAAGVIELVGGIMIALGLFTSIAAFIASGEMAVAFFKAHAPQGPDPYANGGELSVLYCFLFLFMAARGSGIWSLDALINRGRVHDRVDRRDI